MLGAHRVAVITRIDGAGATYLMRLHESSQEETRTFREIPSIE